MRRIVRAVDPEQPVSDVRTLEDVVASETAPRAVQARVLAAFAGRAMAALLAGLDPADGPTFAAAGALCLAATLLGSLWPARRAARVDPIQALRGE